MIFVAGAAFSQKNTEQPGSNRVGYILKNSRSLSINTFALLKSSGNYHIPLIPAGFYTNNFGFICRQELKLDKITRRVLLRLRLGSVEACNRLEGK